MRGDSALDYCQKQLDSELASQRFMLEWVRRYFRMGLERYRLAAENPDIAKYSFNAEKFIADIGYRRKIAKELAYDERSKPMIRRALKAKKLKAQDGMCAICHEQLPAKYNVLDRFRAADGYTMENTRLICQECDRKVQQERGFA